MGALLAAVLLAGVPVPPECEAPPLRDVTPLRALAQKSGALSVGHDSVATWCFDSQGAWTGGQAVKANRKPDPAATPSGDCAKAIAACEAARADIGEPLKQLLVDALADLDRPYRGQKYVSKRSGLGERPADAADCRSKDRSVLFALAQARMDLARLASMAQSEYGVYRTWVMTEGYRCAQEVRARPDLTRLTVSRDAPLPAQEGSGIAGVATAGTGSAGGNAGAPAGAGSTIASSGSVAPIGAAGPGTTTAAGGSGKVANGGSTITSGGGVAPIGAAGPGTTTAATGSGRFASGGVDPSGKGTAAGPVGPGTTTTASGPGQAASGGAQAVSPGTTTPASGSGKVANVDSSGKGLAAGAAGSGATTPASGSRNTEGVESTGKGTAAGSGAGDTRVYGGTGSAVGLSMTRTSGATDAGRTPGPPVGAGSTTDSVSGNGTSPSVIVAAAGTFPGTVTLQSAQRTDAGTLVVVLNAPVAVPGPVLPAKVPAAVTVNQGGAAGARAALLERWHGLADRRAACEADRDYTLGFLASHELAACRCERVAPSVVLARLEGLDPKMEAAEEKAHVCEDCTQAAYDAWKMRSTKQCALIEKLSDYEVEVLTRSLDGQGLPPRCFDVVRARRPAGRTTTAAAPTSPDPRFVITRADAGVAPAAPAQAVVTSPVADTFLKAQEWAPVPLREDGRLYVRLFMSSACRAEILPGPIEARTGDLLLIPWGARRLSVRSSCGGLAEVYWGQEARPRVSEIFARSEPLVLEFKPQ